MMQRFMSHQNYSNADTITVHGIGIKLSRVRLALSACPKGAQHSPVLNDGITLHANTFTVPDYFLKEPSIYTSSFDLLIFTMRSGKRRKSFSLYVASLNTPSFARNFVKVLSSGDRFMFEKHVLKSCLNI